MGVSDSELTSWGNSLGRVAAPLRRSTVPEDAGVSIECQLPMSSKRIDFILSGYNADGEPHVVIIELKQWSEVSMTAQDGLVQTFLGGGIRTTSHPSYQAWDTIWANNAVLSIFSWPFSASANTASNQ